MLILVTAVDAGSLSAAARHLGTPLATVSRKVSDLEAYLKTTLLNRSSRRLTLTDAGRNYVAACKRILEEVGEAERAASGEYSAPKGDLIITAPIVFGRLHVLPAVAEFLETYPEINIRLVLADRAVNLLEEHVDLGTHHNCVTFEALMSPDSWTFAIGKSDVSVPVHSRLVVNTAEAAIDAAIAGIGITRVLSYQIAAAMRAGTLAIALHEFEPPPWPVHLVYAGGRLLPLKLRAFLDFAAQRLRAQLSERAG